MLLLMTLVVAVVVVTCSGNTAVYEAVMATIDSNYPNLNPERMRKRQPDPWR